MKFVFIKGFISLILLSDKTKGSNWGNLLFCKKLISFIAPNWNLTFFKLLNSQ